MIGRAAAKIARVLATLALAFGGLCVLAMIVAGASYVFGDREFPGLDGTPTPVGTYLWQVGLIVIGCFVVWRVCMLIVVRFGTPRDVARAVGRGLEYDEYAAMQDYQYAPVIARCSACPGLGFTSWDEALEHAENEHGHNRLPEEARALLVRL